MSKVKYFSGCQQGFYGDNCMSTCPDNCLSNMCELDTGNCFQCDAGYKGPRCDMGMCMFTKY